VLGVDSAPVGLLISGFVDPDLPRPSGRWGGEFRFARQRGLRSRGHIRPGPAASGLASGTLESPRSQARELLLGLRDVEAHMIESAAPSRRSPPQGKGLAGSAPAANQQAHREPAQGGVALNCGCERVRGLRRGR